MKKFKLIRIDAKTGASSLMLDGVNEKRAWDRSYELEEIESKRYDRRYWYAVTSAQDWQELGAAFVRHRANSKI